MTPHDAHVEWFADMVASDPRLTEDERRAWSRWVRAAQERVRELEALLERAALMLRAVPANQRHVLGIGGEGVTHWYIMEQWLADYDLVDQKD